MIIDLILDRPYNRTYRAAAFYRDVMLYGEVGHDITRAMDYGTEDDVKRALCAYIINQGYSLDCIKYVMACDWLE